MPPHWQFQGKTKLLKLGRKFKKKHAMLYATNVFFVCVDNVVDARSHLPHSKYDAETFPILFLFFVYINCAIYPLAPRFARHRSLLCSSLSLILRLGFLSLAFLRLRRMLKLTLTLTLMLKRIEKNVFYTNHVFCNVHADGKK